MCVVRERLKQIKFIILKCTVYDVLNFYASVKAELTYHAYFIQSSHDFDNKNVENCWKLRKQLRNYRRFFNQSRQSRIFLFDNTFNLIKSPTLIGDPNCYRIELSFNCDLQTFDMEDLNWKLYDNLVINIKVLWEFTNRFVDRFK